jgi:hypothetical protein
VSSGSASASVAVTVVVSGPTIVSGGPITIIPFVADGGGVSTTLTILNPHATATNASIAFFANNGTPLPMPVGAATAGLAKPGSSGQRCSPGDHLRNFQSCQARIRGSSIG